MTRGLASSASCSARGAAVWRRGSFGFVDSVFFLRRHPATRVTGAGSCIPRRSRETSWSCRSRGKVEARTGWSAFSGALGERASLFDRKPCLLPYGPVGLPSRGIPRRLLVVQSEEGEAVCCVLLCMLPLRPSPYGRRLPYRTDGGPALVVVGVDEPSSGLCPDGRRVSPHVLSILDQRGDGVTPGRGRWSSWHRGPL